MDITLPDEVIRIISSLEENGYEAYAVGGCVRDSLLGRKPDDWDITTSAEPHEVKRIFRATIDTGLKHGTVTVRMNRQSFEVTTYRIDGKYSDGRHPERVEFTKSLKEDLKRRDFTINAMAYNPNSGVIDYYDGESDLEKGIIKCVGDARQRFSEDALRMLRAVRFSAQLGFEIDKSTYDAIVELHETINMVSAERIRVETEKLLISEHPEMMRSVYETGLSSVYLPEWDACFKTEQNTKHHCYNVAVHTIEVMKALPCDRTLRLAGLLHDIAKPLTKKTDKNGIDHFVGHPQVGADMARKILSRLKYDNDTIDEVSLLVRYHDDRPKPSLRNARRFASRVGKENAEKVFILKRADIYGQSDYLREEKCRDLEKLQEYYRQIIEAEDALQVKDLKVNGKDIMDCGIKKGPDIGRILNTLLKEVVDEPEKNTRDYLLKRARTIAVLFFMIITVALSGGCAKSNSNAGESFQGTYGQVDRNESEEDAEEVDDEDGTLYSDTYVITDLIDEEERFVLKSLTTNRQYRFAYGLSTKFLDKWGNITSQTDFVRGCVVTIGKPVENVISEIKLHEDAWVVDNLTNFSYDVEKEEFKIGTTKYRIRPSASVFSDDLTMTVSDVTSDDRLRVVGIDKEVLSITVTTGHGYIALQNTSFFSGSLITIGTKIHAMLGSDTVMSVPAGTYKITVAKDGYGGTTEISVGKNETVTVDLDTLKGEGPKMCELTFHVPIDDAHIYVDNKEVTVDEPISVAYGEHKLKIEAKGYDTWEKTLIVNSPSAEITLDPSEDEKTEDDTSSSKDTSSDNKASSDSEASQANTSQSENTDTEKSTSQDEDSDSSSSSSKNQAELDYLTTLSNMIDKITGND